MSEQKKPGHQGGQQDQDDRIPGPAAPAAQVRARCGRCGSSTLTDFGTPRDLIRCDHCQ